MAILGLMLVTVSGIVNAATEAEKQAAIDEGLEWLAQNQQADGRWNAGDDFYDTAATGSALLAFLEEGYSAGSDVIFNSTNYGDVVGDGFSYLLSRAQVYGISGEPAGNPDGDGNNVGLKFVPGGNHSRDTYDTGLVLPAFAASGTPNTVVTTGPLAGRTDGTGPGGAWTYRDVVQNTIDYFAYGQSDSGWARGGWRYYADYNQSDNSTSQWPVVSMLYAKQMGINAPTYVETELDYWIGYIQNPNDGGSYYDSNFGGWGSNMSRTGALLLEMAYSNWDNENIAGGKFSTHQASYNAALNYVNNQWQTYANSTWNGNFGHPYAMWAVYKGLQTTIGLSNTTAITNLRTFDSSTMNLDTGDTWNWYEDYCEYLVDTQGSGGNWGGYSHWNQYFATSWNINILNATTIEEPIPEPGTVMLLGGGLLGLLGLVIVRRRKKK
jgi:hypothetical protein